MINIMLVDDYPMALEGMKEILKEAPNFKVIGEAMSGNEAVEKLDVLMPDVILMDINLPDMNGMEATRRIKNKYPHIKIIIVTASKNIIDLLAASQHGA